MLIVAGPLCKHTPVLIVQLFFWWRARITTVYNRALLPYSDNIIGRSLVVADGLHVCLHMSARSSCVFSAGPGFLLEC